VKRTARTTIVLVTASVVLLPFALLGVAWVYERLLVATTCACSSASPPRPPEGTPRSGARWPTSTRCGCAASGPMAR
jgi:hypothetical protein